MILSCENLNVQYILRKENEFRYFWFFEGFLDISIIDKYKIQSDPIFFFIIFSIFPVA